MAKTKISEFSSTPGNNTDIDGINIAEGCAPSGINNAIRELMSQLKDFQAGTAGDSFNGPVGTSTAAAGAFTTLSASGAVTLSGGTANGVPYLNGSKVLTSGSALVFDGTNLGVGTSSTLGNSSVNAVLGFAARNSGATPGYFQTFNSNAGADLKTWRIGGDSSGNLVFETVNDAYSSSTNRMTLSSAGNLTLPAGTANGVAYLNGSKVLTTGSALTFDGTNLATTGSLSLGAGTNLTWGGAYGANIPTIAGSSNTLQFYPAGSTSGEQMRLTSTGLGIGTSSPAARLQVTASSSSGTSGADGARFNAGGNVAINIGAESSSGYGWIQSANWGSGYINTAINPNGGNVGIGTSSPGFRLDVNGVGNFQGVRVGTNGDTINGSTGLLAFQTSGSERARIDSSGNLLVGTASFSSGRINAATASGLWGIAIRDGFGNQAMIQFVNSAGAQAGSITISGTTTTYGSGSDYRLKDEIVPMTGALEKVQALKPVTWKWKADGSDGQGFIAHELAEVCPDAVHGDKDAVNKDGSIKPQMVDTSFLVATLTAALQEAHGLIKDLQSRVAALEAK